MLFVVHGFLRDTYDVNEDTRLDTMFQLNVKGMKSTKVQTLGELRMCGTPKINGLGY